MKKKVLIGSVVGAIVLLGGAALALHTPDKPKKAAENLITTPVALADIEDSVMATGTLQPAQVIDVNPRISGQLLELNVKMGDKVTKGQIIGKIDSRNLINQLNSAENQLRRAMSTRTNQQVTLTAAINDQTRQKALLATGASSQTRVDQADDAVRRAETALRNSELTIQNAQIEIEDAKNSLEKANVVAPIDGIVADVLLTEGATMNITRQQPVILRIAVMKDMVVRAGISEADITKISAGQDVYFTIQGDPYTRYPSKLRTVDFTPSTGSLTPAREGVVKDAIYYDGLFDVANADGRLLPGMTANVHVVIGGAKQSPTIPMTALGRPNTTDHYTVRVVEASGRVVERDIVTGVSDRLNIQVKSGLKAGEKVVIGEKPAV